MHLRKPEDPFCVSLCSLIFVGCSGTLVDPTHLAMWKALMDSKSAVKHYLLVRSCEVHVTTQIETMLQLLNYHDVCLDQASPTESSHNSVHTTCVRAVWRPAHAKQKQLRSDVRRDIRMSL